MPGAEPSSTRGGQLYLPTFDGIRGWIIVLIVCAHVRLIAEYVPNHDVPLHFVRGLFFSVDFLLVISGFVLFLPVAASGRLNSKRAFVIKRVGRIVPNYYLSLLCAVLFMTFTSFGPASGLPVPEFEDVLWHALFLQIPMEAQAGLGISAVLWVMSIIVFFYLLMPLVALSFRRRPIPWILGGIAISALWRVGIDQQNGRLYTEFPLFLDDFVIGMGAALAYVKLGERGAAPLLRRISLPLSFVPAAALVTFMCLGGGALQRGEIIHQGEAVWISVGVALCFATLVVASAFLPSWAQWPLSNRFSRWLGEISYGVFLYHAFIVFIVGDTLGLTAVGNPQGFLLFLAIVLPLSLLVSWISYITVERPMRERIRRFGDRYEQPKSAESGAVLDDRLRLGVGG